LDTQGFYEKLSVPAGVKCSASVNDFIEELCELRDSCVVWIRGAHLSWRMQFSVIKQQRNRSQAMLWMEIFLNSMDSYGEMLLI